MTIKINRDYDTVQPLTYSAPTPVRTDSDLRAKIDSQVSQIQCLWEQYYTPVNSESRFILAQILSQVNDLESMLVSMDADPEIAVVKDYLLACRINLEESSPEQPIRRPLSQNIEKDFELRNVPGDGNCAIHAALTTIDPAMNTHEVVHLVRGDMVRRMQAAFYDEIDNHWDDVLANQTHYVPTLGEHHGDKEVARRLADQYCKRMSRNGAWLGERELPFLSDVVGKTICVYKPRLDGIVRYGQHKDSVALFQDASHYQALLPKPHPGPDR